MNGVASLIGYDGAQERNPKMNRERPARRVASNGSEVVLVAAWQPVIWLIAAIGSWDYPASGGVSSHVAQDIDHQDIAAISTPAGTLKRAFENSDFVGNHGNICRRTGRSDFYLEDGQEAFGFGAAAFTAQRARSPNVEREIVLSSAYDRNRIG